MHRLAENFIFRKIKRLRKTESGRSISEEEEWREEVHLIRDDDSADQPSYLHYPHYSSTFSNTSSTLSSKTPPKVPLKPTASSTTTTSDPWASFYEEEGGSEGTGNTILQRPCKPTELAEENVTESFAIHRYFDAEYLTHSIFSSEGQWEIVQLNSSWEPVSLAPTPRLAKKSLQSLGETPTNSISERIANEEVAEVLKDCNSMVGVEPINDLSASNTPAVELEKDNRHSSKEEPREVDLPERMTYKGQPINVQISGPIHFLTTTLSYGDRENLKKASKPLQKYVESLVDLPEIFKELSSRLKQKAEPEARGCAFTYQIHSATSLVHRDHQRPPSAPPYLVQSNSYCHSAKVIEITQEWRLGREPEVGQARGVFVPWRGRSLTSQGYSSLPPKSPSLMRSGRQPPKAPSSPLPPPRRPTPPIQPLKRSSPVPQTNGYLTLPSAKLKEPVQLHKTMSEERGPLKSFPYIDSQQYSSLKQTIRQVEQDLDSAQALTMESRAKEARLIEQAIWAISERLSPHPNVTWTKAQAAANEELLRTRLAEMILNLNDTSEPPNYSLATNGVVSQQEQVSHYHYGLLKEPIEILRQKLNCLEKFVEEEDSIQEELTALKHLPTPDRHTPTNQRKVKALQKRHQDIARMTPLIVVVKGKLTNLEEITQKEGKAAAQSGRNTPYQERRTIYDLLMQINDEINTIHELCRLKELRLDGMNAVVEVLSKVCFHLDAILETLRGQQTQPKPLSNGSANGKKSLQEIKRGNLPKSRGIEAMSLGLATKLSKPSRRPPTNGLTTSSTSKELDAESATTISTMQESVNSFVFGQQDLQHLKTTSQPTRKPLPRRLLEEAAVVARTLPSPTYGHRLMPQTSPRQTAKTRQYQPTVGHSLTQVEVSVQLSKRAEQYLVKGSLPIGVLNMQMSQYIEDDRVSIEDRSVQMVCEDSDDTTATNNTSSQLKGTVNIFQAPCHTHLSSLINSAEHSPLPFSQIGYNFVVEGKSAASAPRKDSGVPLDSSPLLKNPQQRSVTPLATPTFVHLHVPQEEEEEGTSSCLSLSENVPILFRKVSDMSNRKETAIMTDEEGEQPSTSLSTMHVYNLKSSCTETFDLRRRRRHALLNAVVFPEARAQITATFLGNSFQIDIERMSETGRESVVMVSEEFYSKKMKITRKSHTNSPILEKLSNSNSEDESVFVDTLAKLNVSIMAKSATDNVHVHLEEIPWGQVDLETKVPSNQPMDRSFNSEAGGASLLFNIHVAENQDEARSVASHRLEMGSETKSVAGLSIGTNLSLSHSQEDLDIATYVIKQGSTASITCELNNYVDKSRPIEWYRNGKEKVDPSFNGQHSKFERISHDLLEVLIIQNVQLEDGQLYSIKVNGEMYPVAYLIIEEGDESQSAPKFLGKSPQTMFVMQGQTAIMSCQMNKSRLDVVWYRETEQLVPGTDDRVFFESTGNGWYRVIVEDVDFGDQGTYYAYWQQNYISITLVVEEKIDEREVQVSSAETEDEELSDYLVPSGSTATIACELDTSSEQLANQPSPQLYWQRNSRDLNTSETSSGKFEHVISHNKHYLIIHNAQPRDSGVYSVRINDTRFKVAQITISDGLFNRHVSGSRIKRISNNSLNIA